MDASRQISKKIFGSQKMLDRVRVYVGKLERAVHETGKVKYNERLKSQTPVT